MANLGKKSTGEPIDISSAKVKIARYCAYQERAHSEVNNKLISFGLTPTDREEILAWLITENYLNEERYAVTVAGGKFRAKKWGKLKIQQFLKQKDVSEYSINQALSQIDQEEYQATLEMLIRNKWEQASAPNIFELRNKIARYILGKGYEPDLSWDLIKEVVKE